MPTISEQLADSRPGARIIDLVNDYQGQPAGNQWNPATRRWEPHYVPALRETPQWHLRVAEAVLEDYNEVGGTDRLLKAIAHALVALAGKQLR